MRVILLLIGLLSIACSVLSTLFIVAPCEPGFGWRFYVGCLANGSAFSYGMDAVRISLKGRA